MGRARNERVVLHSKVLVLDDTLLSVGSANVSDRSMALDTEANLTLNSSLEGVGPAPICGFLVRLLAEHLGRNESTVRETLERRGSLIETVDLLSQPERGLEPLGNEYPSGSKKRRRVRRSRIRGDPRARGITSRRASPPAIVTSCAALRYAPWWSPPSAPRWVSVSGEGRATESDRTP